MPKCATGDAIVGRHVPRIPSHRTLTGRSCLADVPGNKLPGYDHSVPPGRKYTHSPIRRLAPSPFRPFAYSPTHAHTLPTLRFVLFRYLRRHQLWVRPIRSALVLEDAIVHIFPVTRPQPLPFDYPHRT